MNRFILLVLVMLATGAEIKACDEDDLSVKPDFSIHKPYMLVHDSINYCLK